MQRHTPPQTQLRALRRLSRQMRTRSLSAVSLSCRHAWSMFRSECGRMFDSFKTYGQPTAANTISAVPLVAKVAATTTQRPLKQATKVPRTVAATFILRDAITIFGSIILPPMLSPFLSDSYFQSPAMKIATLQLSVPIISQFFATPVHLMALDLYNNPKKNGSTARLARMRRDLAPTTATRCSRIIPAFGVGLVVNTGLRNHFHRLVGVNKD
jgi:hypothetical protein